MRLSTRPRIYGEGDRAFATFALPCAPPAAPPATTALSPACFRRNPLSGASTRAGEATTTRRAPAPVTTAHRIHVTVNEGVTA
ncbi:hypothetical protein GCM10028797_17820 [Dyella agri]